MNVVWWRLRTSNPLKGGNFLGEFDSHTPPPYFFYRVASLPGFENQEYIVCFQRVAKAIMAEQALLEGKFSVRVMPVPSGIREGCGFCLRLSPEELERAAAFLLERGITLTEAYIPEEGVTVTYRRISLTNGRINDTER